MAREMSVKQKERLQFDFTLEAIKRLDELKEKTEAATRAETVRHALRLYEWFVKVKDVDPDSTIQIINKNKEVTATVPMEVPFI